MNRIKLTAALVIALSAQSTHAQLPEEAESIVRFVLSVNGYITEDLHTQFWSSIREIPQVGDDLTAFSNYLSQVLLPLQEYQYELYKCAELSIAHREVVMTDRFKDVANGVWQMRPGLEALAQEFLESAAYQKVIHSPDGRSLTVTEEVVSKTLPTIEASFERLQRLVEVSWSEQSR